MEAINAIEGGNIYFFYRQNIREDFPESGTDIQHFFMVMNPHDQRLYRLAILGKKTGEEGEGSERIWGVISKVTSIAEQVESEMDPRKYLTKSRGERQLKSSRLCGEGLYRIVKHANHTHLAYCLEVPENPDEIVQQLALEREASYILRIRNPAKPSPKTLGLENLILPDYPARLDTMFEDRRFIDADPPEFLDYEGTGIMLVSSVYEHINSGLELERNEEANASADILNQLRYDLGQTHLEPLIRGRWR
ncbi:MAG: hypothetical protein A2Y07_03635 [Planctomycetes bacterium GWF2_50_10]|nr:MAG: hypothetical protein A2Y07_03635 [Planctomycetes bacterium GWF2_50_10]